MAGIVFPNLLGTIAPLMQLEQADRRNALAERAYAREEEDRAREREAAVDVPAALAGDKNALGRLSAKSPKTAFALAPLLERADTAQRTRVKEAADWTSRAALGVLSVPPEQRPQAYLAALQDGQARGYDVSKLPPQYGPDVEGRLNFYVNQARDVNKWFEEQGKAPKPIGDPAPDVPATVTPDATAKGKQYVSYLTGTHGLSPTAAAGVVGGLVQESGLDPGYGYTRPGGDNGTAHGMGQWRLDRAQALSQFAQARGKPPTDPNTQLDFLVTELKSGDMGAQRAYAMLQQAKTPEEATTAMMHFFRPQGYTPNNPQGGHGYAQRVQYARQFMPTAGPVQGDSPPADGSGTPLPPRGDGLDEFRAMRLPPGARFIGIEGKPIIENGVAFVLLADGRRTWLPLPERKAPTGTGPFAGSSVDAQALNMLIANGTLTQQQAAELAAGKTITNPADGSIIFMTPSGLFKQPQGGGAPVPAAPAGQPQPGQPAPAAQPTGNIPVTPPKSPIMPGEMAKFREAQAEGQTIIDALENFRTRLADAGFGERAKSAIGVQTPLNTSFNAAALLAKGEALFNLGVLNGPDLDIIRRTLPDPASLGSTITSQSEASDSIDQIINLIKTRLAAKARILGVEQAPQPAAAGGDVNVDMIPRPARDRLKANPAEASQFDEVFGKGAAAKVLGR